MVCVGCGWRCEYGVCVCVEVCEEVWGWGWGGDEGEEWCVLVCVRCVVKWSGDGGWVVVCWFWVCVEWECDLFVEFLCFGVWLFCVGEFGVGDGARGGVRRYGELVEVFEIREFRFFGNVLESCWCDGGLFWCWSVCDENEFLLRWDGLEIVLLRFVRVRRSSVTRRFYDGSFVRWIVRIDFFVWIEWKYVYVFLE